MARKTYEVDRLVAAVNRRNRFSKVDPSIRQGWNDILEEVLLETGNYQGFDLLGPKDVPLGHLPGKADEGDGDKTRRLWRLTNDNYPN